MRREVRRSLMRPHILLQVFDMHAAEVAVEVRGEWRHAVVLRRFHLFGNRRVDAISANDDLRLLFDTCTVPCVTADPGHPVAVPDQALQRELFPELDAAHDGSIDEQLVEHGAPRTEATPPAVRIDHAAV